jgi:predicted dehydrogenase
MTGAPGRKASARPEDGSRIRAAVVGVGEIGALHARVYAEDVRTELAAVVDVDHERARRVAAALGAAWYGDVDAMLASERVDVVSIATPEQARYRPAVACARAGKDLLLEKPLAPALDETDRLIRELEATGVTVMVNFILRSEPRYVRARQALAEGAIGQPCTIFARRRVSSLAADVYAPWTDLLISTAIHDLDTMIWLNGAVDRVSAEGVNVRSAGRGDADAVACVLRFANGAVGLLETSWVLPPTLPSSLDVSLHIVATRGAVFLDGADHGFALLGSDGWTRPDLAHWPVGRDGVEGALRASIAAFISAVEGRCPPVATLADARAAEELVAAVKLSLERGAPVRVPLGGD